MATDTVKKILIVEDDHAIRLLLHRFLSGHNYQVESAADGKAAMAVFEQFDPHLVILDINLPDISGQTLLGTMQSRTDVPVLVLTSLTEQPRRIKMLADGADDYMTKPFDLEELAVRVEVILRRIRERRSPTQECLIFGALSIDPERREVKLKDAIVTLTALEFDLLRFLASNPGRVWRREELIQNVWGYNYVGDQRVVDVHIGQIRHKIEHDRTQPAMIHTVRGVGYKFEPPQG
jgi:DNA-binding response OmpR family regulator